MRLIFFAPSKMAHYTPSISADKGMLFLKRLMIFTGHQ